jgi:hypothetical protein
MHMGAPPPGLGRRSLKVARFRAGRGKTSVGQTLARLPHACMELLYAAVPLTAGNDRPYGITAATSRLRHSCR